MRGISFAIAVVASGCTLGLDQSFDMTSGPAVSDQPNDLLFDLTNRGGNAPESFDIYRITISDHHNDGYLAARGDKGDAKLSLVQDGGTPGVVDPGDVIRVVEDTDHGMKLGTAENGKTLWVDIMVVAPSQRSSDALTVSWQTVWSAKWHVGS